MQSLKYIFLLGSMLTSFNAWGQSGGSMGTGGASLDCGDTEVSYQDDDGLTRDEKTALMDAALFASLNRYDACQRQSANTQSSNQGGGGQASSASSGMTGTEEAHASAAQQSNGASGAVQDTSQGAGDAVATAPAAGGTSDSPAARGNGRLRNSGKLPEDIPPADNDSVLEAQIRRAAEAETDPAVRKRLWNEYRKYKGLPTVQ